MLGSKADTNQTLQSSGSVVLRTCIITIMLSSFFILDRNGLIFR